MYQNPQNGQPPTSLLNTVVAQNAKLDLHNFLKRISLIIARLLVTSLDISLTDVSH